MFLCVYRNQFYYFLMFASNQSIVTYFFQKNLHIVMDIELFYQDLKSYWDTDILTIAKMYSLDGDVDSLRRQIAMIHASKRGNMLSGGVMSFVERLPELQRVAVERNDRSFPNVGKEYVDRLLELVTDQKQFKRDLKRMTPEQKRQVETELNQLESALKNNNDWNTIQRIRELFDIPQQYFDWTLKSYIRGTIHRLEDVSSRLKPAISDFEWLKKKDKIDRKEKIQQFNGLTSLEEFLEKYEDDLIEKRQIVAESEQSRNEGKLIYDGRDIKIIQPLTEGASCYYGKGTRWCTAATESKNWFNEYASDGPIFIIQPKNPGNGGKEKYQIHFEGDQFKDEKDDDVDFKELVDKYPEISMLRKHSPLYILEYYKKDIEDEDIDLLKSLKLIDKEAQGMFKQGDLGCKVVGYLLSNYDIIEGELGGFTFDNVLSCSKDTMKKFIDILVDKNLLQNLSFLSGYLIEKNSVELYKYLLQRGYKPSIKDTEMQSDLNFAIEWAGPEIVQLIANTIDGEIEMPDTNKPEIINILLPYAKNKHDLLNNKRVIEILDELPNIIEKEDVQRLRELMKDVHIQGKYFDNIFETLVDVETDPKFLSIFLKSDAYDAIDLQRYIAENI